MTGTKSLLIGLLLMCCLTVGARAEDEVMATAGWSGPGFLMQEKWGVLGVNVNNRTSSDIDVMVLNRFDAASTVHYSQQVWVPADASRRVWQPVRMPSLSEEELRNDKGGIKKDVAIPMQTLMLETLGGQERTRGRYEGVVRLENGTSPTGVVVDGDSDDPSLDAISAARKSVGAGPRLSTIRVAEMPSFGAGLNVLDTFFLTKNDPGLDPAQTAALQNWILNGGRIWVLAEQVSPEFMAKLLHDDWSIQTVDHVDLMRVTIDGMGAEEMPGSGKDGETRKITLDFEKPVDFARSVVSDMEVLHTVNGWPASARKQIGRGWLYVTFIGPEAMIHKVPALDAKPGDSKTEIKPVPAIDWLANEFFKPPTPPPLEAANFVNYLQQEIGHKIIGRGLIVAVLGGFAALLLITGLILAKRGKLELIGPLGATGAVVAAMTLLVIGYLHRAQRPLMTVSTHLAEVWPAQNVAVITGELGVYSPDADKGPMRSLYGGVAWPDIRGQDGNILRMHWLDMDQWEWKNLTLPAGAVRSSDVNHMIPLEKTPRLTAKIDESGVLAKFEPGSLESLEDVLLSTNTGNISPKIAADGTFRITDDQILPVGQYIASGLQNQVQSRRQQMYKTMMNNKLVMHMRAIREKRSVPGGPMLMGWTPNVKVGMDLIQECERLNSALTTLPMTFDPVAPGTKVSIPSLLMTRGNNRVIGAQDMPVDRGDYDVGMTMEMRFAVTFIPPQVATPMTLSEASLYVDLRAPGRPVQIWSVPQAEGESRQLIASLDSPTEPMTISLDKISGMEIKKGGAVTLVVAVMPQAGATEVGDPSALKPWRIRDIRMSVKGSVH